MPQDITNSFNEFFSIHLPEIHVLKEGVGVPATYLLVPNDQQVSECIHYATLSANATQLLVPISARCIQTCAVTEISGLLAEKTYPRCDTQEQLLLCPPLGTQLVVSKKVIYNIYYCE